MRRALPFFLLLAACGGGGADGNAAVTSNQLEQLSTPQVETQDPQASARLQPITVQDLEREGLLGAGCEFSSDGVMLLASVGSDAIIRVEDEIRHLVQSAPPGPTGAFFEERQLSVSVGRTGQIGAAADESTAWPARLTVTNRRSEVQVELAGVWTCGV